MTHNASHIIINAKVGGGDDLAVELPDQAVVKLNDLVNTGLYGENAAEAAQELILQGLRKLSPRPLLG